MGKKHKDGKKHKKKKDQTEYTLVDLSPALTQAAVRVSLGWTTTEADVLRFIDAWRKLGTALSKGQGIAA